ncbi:MAG: Rrf2 family transcriptional regulator [Patescibacteria group bacterium]|jgi:Rrf2 family protein|nr:Rrf2 family transcriptional regulator [Patescibacteria group bacterium]
MNSLFRVSARNHAGMIMMTMLASAKGEFLSLQEIADCMHLSQGFLEEIAMSLKKAGLISGRKGPGGGYQLAKPAAKITAEQILVALEGPVMFVDCGSGHCPVASACSSKSLWSFLQKDVIASLKKTNLAQIVIK